MTVTAVCVAGVMVSVVVCGGLDSIFTSFVSGSGNNEI